MDFKEILEMDRAYIEACGPGEPDGSVYYYSGEMRPPQELVDAARERYPFSRMGLLPRGWRRAFGLYLHEDLRTVLLALGGEEMLRNYKVHDVKEKYGELRWDGSAPGIGWFRRNPDDPMTPFEWLHYVTEFYGDVSEHTCIRCGGVDDVRQSTGWILPVCPCDSRWESATALERPRRGEPFCLRGGTDERVNVKDVIVGSDAPIVSALGLDAPLHATAVWERLALR